MNGRVAGRSRYDQCTTLLLKTDAQGIAREPGLMSLKLTLD